MDPSQNSQHHRGAANYGTNGNRIDLNNFNPDWSKSNALKARLYDSGISNNPMPSVKRPIEENISTKPFSAKMNSSKIQALSPLKKKIQDLNTAIISNLNESYREAAIKEAEYLGDGTADYYRSQHIIIPQPTYLRESGVGQKLQSSMAVSVGQPRMTGQLLNRKQAQVAPLDPEYQNKVNEQLSKTQIDPSRVMTGPPALVYAGFEGGASMSQKNLEQARSKYLLDKLTGKLPPRSLPPLGKETEAQASTEEFKGTPGTATGAKPKGDAEPANVVHNLREENSKKPKKPQQWGELDKYIELLLDTRSEEETVFTYLNCPNKNDPYDLVPVGFNLRDMQQYYTISGKGLTLYQKDQPVEFMSLGQWLIERDSYNHIKDFSFFKQFKSWKFMRMWKKTIKQQHKMKAYNQLEENLFILQKDFCSHLFEHRKLMLKMSEFRFVDCCQSSEFKKLDEFSAAQEDKRTRVGKDIEKKSEDSRKNIQLLFDAVLKKLRDQIVGEITMDETNAQKNPEPKNNAVSIKKNENNSVYEALEFPAGMTYAHRSSLRRECSRFLRFAYLADFLSLEALSNIYIDSVAEMIERIKVLDDHGTSEMEKIMVMEFDDSNTAAQAPRGRDPLFYTTFSLNDKTELPANEILDEPIDDFMLPPRGKSVPEEFDLEAHLSVREAAEGEEEDDDAGDDDEDKDEQVVQLFRKITPNIQSFWIKLTPDCEQFINALLKTFQEGLQAIKCFERWSKHADLLKYSEALETWDDKVGDDWGDQNLETTALEPAPWILEHPIQKDHENHVRELVKSAYSKAQRFMTRFQPLLEIYWRNKQFNVEILVDENLVNSVESLQNTLALLKWQHNHFQTQLPGVTDIGLLHLDSKKIKAELAPTPRALQDEVEKIVPRVTKERTLKVLDWLQQSIRDLQRPVNDVSDFVLQIQDFNRINEQFQPKRDAIDLYGQFHGVLLIAQFKIKKEDENAIKDAEKEISRLSQILANVESKQEAETERFKKELDSLIPQLDIEVEQLKEESQLPQYLDKNSDMGEMIKQLDEKMAKFTELQETSVKYNRWQEELRTQPTIFTEIDELKIELEARHTLWHALSEWKELKDGYEKMLWNDINDEEIKKNAEMYSKTANRLLRTLPSNPIVDDLKYLVDTFKEAMPIVEACRNKNLNQEHWDCINDMIPNGKIDIEDETFTLQSLIDLDVNQYQDEIVAISRRATGEAKLRADLAKLDEAWKDLRLVVVQYKDRDGVLVLDGKGVEELYAFLDENLANINMIRGNQYKAVVEKQAESLRKQLITMNTVTEELVQLQRSWIHLENVFASAEIKRVLSTENTMFEKIDQFFKQQTTTIDKMQTANKFLGKSKNLTDALKEKNDQVDAIMKALANFLETKRNDFPRFSFLSDEELLDILAKQNDPHAIQGYLKQLFDGLFKLELTETNDSIAMLSREGEKIDLKKAVKHTSKVEEWLTKIQEEMKNTLSRRLKEGNGSFPSERSAKKEWILDQPSQIVLTVDMIQWCSGSTEAIEGMCEDADSLTNWLNQNDDQLKMLTDMVRGNLTDLQRLKLSALITQDVHSKSIIEELQQARVQTINDFNWQKQLRYTYEEIESQGAAAETLCVIRQVSAMLFYGFEYMGATTRLVITPLTDKCWITITGALHIKLGANPAGPAGTGKTESTKDLAKGIAILCIVYNCSDQVDYQMMQRHFAGLAMQGCWTCLDEFNRILVEVLSVVAQQLQEIRKALISGVEKFDFQGKTIDIKPEFGCHITMNPGYAGRTELPDNLKVLFRPVAMMIPSYELIAKVMLYAEGFDKSENLARKMVKLYKLSSEQLSQQDHYDFGMRAVKSLLVMAGGLKRANPEDPEDAVLIRAMKDANLPKFLKDDLPLFNAIVQDLFPTVQIKEANYEYFMKNIRARLREKDLQPHVPFMNKVIQLFETFNVRFGVMLVGFTGSGKTTCYETLARVMTHEKQTNPNAGREYEEVKMEVLNPKAISMGELYGQVDLNTQEWTDGLASKLMRNGAAGTEETKEWTVFDGPVDALWIENMNTVLDDNMTLCLANGQRIKLRPQMRMLFEVNDLRVASPATVSRCGMVYLTQEELGWEPFVKTWMETKFAGEFPLTQQYKDYMWEQFEGTINIGIERVRSHPLIEPIKTDNLQLVRSMCNILEITLLDPKTVFKGDDTAIKKDLCAMFAFAYTFGIGSALSDKSKDYFDSTVREQFKAAQYPNGFTVFDYFFSLKDHSFHPWGEKVRAFEFQKEQAFFDIMVETEMTYKHSYFLELLLSGGKPIFFTGETGVGKSVVIQNTLNRLAEKDLVPINLNFSAQTDSLRTQGSIMEKLEKISRKVLGPQGNKRNAIFVDDINMPMVETYGAQPPIELLRLLVDRNGLYERSEWDWKEVIRTTLIACAAPPLGGRSPLCTRFSTNFNMFCLPEATEGMLSNIFQSILGGFLKSWNFAGPVQELKDSCVASTIEIYIKISRELRATPAKFHYSFNLRDVSKVVQGILMTKNVSVPNPDVLTKLWVNEISRVFMDRLIDDEDREWFINEIMELLSRNFKSQLERDDLFGTTKVKFGDIHKIDAGKIYEEIRDQGKLIKALENQLEDYNDTSSNKMNLVFFEDAVLHILRIMRSLRQPRGNIMLIGVGGSGKQSLIRLSSFMYEFQFKQIEIKKDYKQKDFNEFIKELMMASGVMGKEIAFTMTDSHILSESFLEDINNVLNTGEVPNLMIAEDKDYINQELPNNIKIEGSNDVIQQAFVKRVREKFHICLCMSPVGNTLRIRCRQFPSLVNCCTLDWFSKWPAEALLYVSQQKLIEMELPSEDVREELAKMCMLIHTSVEDASEQFWDELRRRVYTTPKSYLDLISLYINTLDRKRKEVSANKNRLSQGLKKLEETNKQIAELKVSLAESAPILAQKDIDLAETMTIVERETAEANVVKAQVEKEEEVVSKQYAEATAVKAEVEDDLAAAQPEMDKAKAAVASLEAPAIVEMASFNTPNPKVALVVEPIMLLMGFKKDWATAQSHMKKTQNFLKALKDFDVKTLKESVIAKVRKDYLSKPEFNIAAMTKISVPAGALCTWTIALSSYQIVYKKIVPKQKKLAEVSKAASEAKAVLDEKLAGVRAAQEKVDKLNFQANQLKEEKAALESKIKRDQGRMRRAEKLVVLLKDEGVRWQQTCVQLDDQLTKLIGDVFLSCACISYFGGFTGDYRQNLTSNWTFQCIDRNIPTNENFSIIKVMGDPVQISEWNLNQLPSDQVSLENGILVTKAERWGLCIDPQEQANKWLKNMHKSEDMRVITLTSDNWLRSVTDCVYNGKPLLIEDLHETIDPAIDPILLHQEFLDEDGTWKIKLDKEEPYPYGESFKLFMTTKMPNPHYPPEVCIKVTLINFTVTTSGLEEQMLGDVVIKEKPEVEAKRQEIVVSMDRDQKTLKAIENQILKLLAENEVEQILDEDTLIITLEQSKVTSAEIHERMANAEEVQKEIEVTRESYTSVAVRGSILYFVIADMARINSMYQNSLQFVKVLFNKAIDATPPSDDLEVRLRDLIDTITRNIYANVSRGLFEADKLIFTYLISTSVNRHAGIITPAGWTALLRGAQPLTAQQRDAKPVNPLPSLMSEISYGVLYSVVCQIAAFEGIIQDMKEREDDWTTWATCMNPQDESMPEPWEEQLTDFQKCVMLKIFRPEKLMFAFKNYVRTHMGQFYVDAQTTTMEMLYNDLDQITPLIFILSTGADPTEMLVKLAKDMNMHDRLGIISLGQGQEKKALNLIADSNANGDWVFLQNCHLSQGFMPMLERAVMGLSQNEEMNPSFRLYLTSMPVDFFPVAVLQNGVKLTTEPPRGIKANLQRSWAEISDDWLNDCKKETIYRKMVFGVSFFHAIVQERRKFGPLGWNVVYEFNDSDLSTSFTMLKIFLDDESADIPWEALVYITGIINYGGRVTDDNDRRCLITTLEKYYCTDNLTDDYFYSESEKYRAPPFGDAQSYRDYINQLPEEDLPEVFGLHDNANIAYQRAESDTMVGKVLSIQPRVAGGKGGGLTPDEIVVEKAKQLTERIPANLDRQDGLKDLFKTHNNLLPSLTTVLLQEMEKFNRLLTIMRKSLDDLVQAIGGFIVMSQTLDDMYLSLTNGVVPPNWEKVAYPSLKPLTAWFEDLIARVEFLHAWLIGGNPTAYWISGFFFPQGFMTGCLQTHARQFKIAIDELDFAFEVLEAEEPDQVEERPAEGVLIYGLYMDGARYNREGKCIDDQYPDELYDKMPLIHFMPKKDYTPSPDEYSCPMYKTGLRRGTLSTTGQSTNFVICVELPCPQEIYAPPPHWIRRAAALLCQLND